jgi:hypothetical protein
MKPASPGPYLLFQTSLQKVSIGCLVLVAIFIHACSPPSASSAENLPPLYETASFKSYWYSGKAEISSYKLSQSRYGEDREGKAMFIFVTEDFSEKKHVKLDHPESAGGDKISVLKMNVTRNFVTGIYPYSMMLSVFSPINRNQKGLHPMKVTMSSQEWCGQVFSQLDLTGKKYVFQSHSYFEKEGEEHYAMKVAWLEDELWNLIRLDPENLPIGEIEIIPGLFFARLNHVTSKPLKAITRREERGAELLFFVNIPVTKRSLKIRFQKAFPYKILGWDESFYANDQEQHTRAVLDKTLVIDYWTKNKNEFRFLRDSLGLSPHNF